MYYEKVPTVELIGCTCFALPDVRLHVHDAGRPGSSSVANGKSFAQPRIAVVTE
jgi:hypothetical protein